MSEDEPKLERISRNKREQAKRDAVTRENVIRTLMAHRDGRRFLWLEISAGNVFSQTFVPGHSDVTAFAEGQRSRALALFNDVTRWAPADYVKMTQENAVVALELEKGGKHETLDAEDAEPAGDE